MLLTNAEGDSWVGIIATDGSIIGQTTLVGCVASNLTVSGGYAYLSTRQSETGSLEIVKIDLADLSVVSAKSYSYYNYTLSGNDISADGNGNIYVVGQMGAEGNPTPFVLKADTNSLGLIGFRNISTSAAIFENLASIVAFNDGSMLLGGYRINASTDCDPWIVRIRADWTVKYQRQLIASSTDWCNSVSSYNGYHFLGCSTSSFSPKGDLSDMLTVRFHDTTSSMSIDSRKRYSTADGEEGVMGIPTSDGGSFMVGAHSHGEGALFVKTEYDGTVDAINRAGSSITNPYVSNVSMTTQTTSAAVTNLTGAIDVGVFVLTQTPSTEVATDIWAVVERMTN